MSSVVSTVDQVNALVQKVAGNAQEVGELSAQAPVGIETAESLEQLRALWLGIPIHVTTVAEPPGHGVDTEEDLKRARAHFAS